MEESRTHRSGDGAMRVMEPEQAFNEAVRHVRYDGLRISDLSPEGFVNVCGRASLSDLETLVEALAQYLKAVTYRPESEG